MKLHTTTAISQKERLTHDGEILFLKQVENSFDGYMVDIDGNSDVPMIIQKHTNPLNKNLHDMKARYLNSTGDFMHMGNIVTTKDGKLFMAVTEPSSNGIYSEYKILPLKDDMVIIDGEYASELKCVIANKGFYDEISYINDANVFEDKDMRATIVQYNEQTSNLTLFDNLYVNDSHYRIVKIDNYTLKEHDEAFGVLQFVLVDTPFGEIVCNDRTTLKGIVIPARVKDKILNSEARELLCEYNLVKRGDYISFTYDRDKQGTMIKEMYIIVNRPTMHEGYDKSLLYLCERTMNLLDDEGNVVNVPLYFEDNRSRIDKTNDGQYSRFSDSSFMIMCQQNEATLRLSNKVRRIIINGKAYEITGIADLKEGIMSIGMELGKIDTNDDNEELGIANYKSQMEEIIGNKPDPTSTIVGSDLLARGFEDEYYLQGAGNGVEWSISCAYVEISQDGSKCYLKFNNLSDVNKTFLLTAKYGGSTFEKSITTSRL